MTDKEILLTAIEDSWATRVTREQLVYDLLVNNNIPPDTSQAIISDSLRKGEVSITNNRLVLKNSGKELLNKQRLTDYSEAASKVFNKPAVKEKSLVNWDRKNYRAAITIGIALIILTAATLYFMVYPIKHNENSTQLKNNSTKQAHNKK